MDSDKVLEELAKTENVRQQDYTLLYDVTHPKYPISS